MRKELKSREPLGVLPIIRVLTRFLSNPLSLPHERVGFRSLSVRFVFVLVSFLFCVPLLLFVRARIARYTCGVLFCNYFGVEKKNTTFNGELSFLVLRRLEIKKFFHYQGN